MSSKMKRIKLPPLTKEEKKALKEFLDVAVEDYFESAGEEGAEIWEEIIQNMKEERLTKEDIETIMEEIRSRVVLTYGDGDDLKEFEELCMLWSIRKKLKKLI